MVTADHSRGQVILIGAIALAFIILGIVVVFNGVLYTETISSSGTSQATTDAELAEHELETAVVTLGKEVNNNESFGSDAFEGALEGPDGLHTEYRNTTSNSRSAFVHVELVDTTTGTVFLDQKSEKLNFNESDEELGHFEVELLDADGNVTVEANRTHDDPDTVEIEGNGADGYEVVDESCEITGEHVRVDLLTGSVNATTEGDCSTLALIEDGESYSDIELEVDGADGTYDYAKLDDGDDVISAELEFTYESNDVSVHDEETEIRIYGGES
ncbi:DUF7261 family protein [Natrarchaeobaculum sulfurireducens]|uniref:Pilin/flagellin n=1 Tax=Natrarchaeobaculum sulfurireducens TaxID=2044521 RepID=A0A346PGD0_9EURY|nr:hypothetical protein [Natrarchaeobaculum sulfurireducens]AXR78575.1 Pilin/flagellin [Natrarchaeobaculum sulfurireducens]AXR81374.1 hypothetical protein AArcMg_1359 [Natrarchaeobaculum sulfurireducens]